MREKKTETLKKRSVYIYLPSVEMADSWKRRARASKTSISKFVIEHVENSLRQEEGDYASRRDLIEKIENFEEENDKLRKDNRMLNIVIEKLERELKRYRTAPFLEEEFTGIRAYEKELVDLLRARKNVKSEEIPILLDIDPRDAETLKGITRQLENLSDYGLVQMTPRGWKWLG